VSLQAPIKVQKLQQALYAKAKESPDFCFLLFPEIGDWVVGRQFVDPLQSRALHE
jgi:hypothetical protein